MLVLGTGIALAIDRCVSHLVDPSCQVFQAMRPIERQPSILCIQQVVEFVNAAEHGDRYDVALAKVLEPLLCLGSSVVVEALDRVDR